VAADVEAHASTTLECRSCGAALAITPGLRTTTCVYCTSPTVVQRPATANRPDPDFVIGFVVTQERALDIARRFIKAPWFAPNEFRRAQPDAISGLYLPAYVYTGSAYSRYSANIGENYTVTEEYETTDANGKTVTRTRQVTKTEWRPLSGQHASYVHDRIVTASRGIPNHELEAIEPFDMRALHRYTAKVISGWAAEEPSLSQAECLALARQEAVAAVGAMLGPFMPGDSHRDLRYETQLAEEHLALALLPIWVLAVRYRPDRPPVRLLVNGQTGRIHGKAPFSWVKVAVLVLAILAFVALIVLLAVSPVLIAEIVR
jgi:hypothetical protein